MKWFFFFLFPLCLHSGSVSEDQANGKVGTLCKTLRHCGSSTKTSAFYIYHNATQCPCLTYATHHASLSLQPSWDNPLMTITVTSSSEVIFRLEKCLLPANCIDDLLIGGVKRFHPSITPMVYHYQNTNNRIQHKKRKYKWKWSQMNFIGPIFNPTDIIFSLQNNRTALNPVQEGFYSSIRHCCVEYAKSFFCNTFLIVHSFVISKKMSINIKKNTTNKDQWYHSFYSCSRFFTQWSQLWFNKPYSVH